MKIFSAAIVNMAMLYAGKISGVLVAFIFLPFYARNLGTEQFGIVAVVLSLQALLVMMDLGMSTVVGREVSVGSANADASISKLISTAEIGLTAFYTLILFAAILAFSTGIFSNISLIVTLGIVVLFWSLVLQNLYYATLIAQRNYSIASLLQILGVGARACLTAYALAFVSATLEAFIITQLIGAVLHGWATRYFCFKRANSSSLPIGHRKRPSIADVVKLTHTGKSLMFFSAAGAAVTQLDKPIISSFVSAASVTPYYLAGMLCMTPISLLASPVSQFFQPMFFRFAGDEDLRKALKVILVFAAIITLTTTLPTLVLWLWRADIINIWLGENADIPLVVDYVSILLPGFIIGALGFVPYSLLLYAKDFRFMASMSIGMTLATLAATFFAATTKDVKAICFIYSAYHASSTVLSWIRALTLAEVRNYAWASALVAVSICFLVLIILGAINLFL